MRRFAILTGVLAVALTAGAAEAAKKVKTQPLTPALAAAMNGKVLAETRRGVADFAARTPGRSAMGFSGRGLSVEVGGRLVAENKVPDPSRAISAELTQALVEKTGARLAATKAFAVGDTPADLAAGAPGAQYVIDVGTTDWGFEPQARGRYGVYYKATVRVVEVASGRVVMTAACDWQPLGVPLYEDADIKAPGAAGVKTHSEAATKACTARLKRSLFGAE